MEETKVLERVELSKSFGEFREDGIFRMTLNDGVHLEVEDARDNHEYLRSRLEYLPLYILADPGKETSVSKEVRDFSFTDEVAGATTNAIAILVNNLAHQIVINFIVRFYKNKTKLKSFKNENEAIVWLRSLIKEEKKKDV